MKKCWNQLNHQLATIAVLVLLASCASTPPPEPSSSIHAQEQYALDSLQLGLHQESQTALAAALKAYEKIDDHPGQWRVAVLQTKLALQTGDLDQASEAASRSLRLAKNINTSDALYQSHLLAGRTNKDSSSYRAALSNATTPLQQAVIETYLGNSARAVQLIDPAATDNPSDRAFVYYQNGRVSGNADDFLKALGFYRAADDARGVADSLVNLAKLAVSGGRKDRAKTYGERAILSLEAAEESDKAEVIKEWLKTL